MEDPAGDRVCFESINYFVYCMQRVQPNCIYASYTVCNANSQSIFTFPVQSTGHSRCWIIANKARNHKQTVPNNVPQHNTDLQQLRMEALQQEGEQKPATSVQVLLIFSIQYQQNVNGIVSADNINNNNNNN
eukprot:TRINITY_DN5828_c0_g2_i1.p2 TRINITY_DN5828_c0_g2~~TRINITY_DN5828_c0_g2_i1.p2  ORF type:complete len:132 (-),score=5.44 TRINITY_DN5828_c0_g2_i1:44-439(-)